MAALRQILNTRRISGQEKTAIDPSDRIQRMIASKMEAMGYPEPSPPVPEKLKSSKSVDQNLSRPLYSRFNHVNIQSSHHPAYRTIATDSESTEIAYNRSNSFDQSRPIPIRSQTETNLAEHGAIKDYDDNYSAYTSMYEENESPMLSPALNKHLALRPLDTQVHQTRVDEPLYKQRRRSRSAATTEDIVYHDTDRWDTYGKEQTTKPPRQDSLGASSKPPSGHEEDSSLVQTFKHRQRSPTQEKKRKADHHRPHH